MVSLAQKKIILLKNINNKLANRQAAHCRFRAVSDTFCPTKAIMMEALNLDEKERYRADLKTKESVRTIPMSPEVEKVLRHYIDRNKFQAQFNPTYQDLGYLFTRNLYQGRKSSRLSPLSQRTLTIPERRF